MERVVVGVDGSETSRGALRWALDEARRQQASVEVVHAWHAGLDHQPGTCRPTCSPECYRAKLRSLAFTLPASFRAAR